MSPLSLAEIPQVQAFQTGLKRLLSVRRVLALVTERRLICCWQHKSLWYWRPVDWPSDSCRDGMPMQREAMSEALEELLFDSDVVGARLELLLLLMVSIGESSKGLVLMSLIRMLHQRP